MVLQTYKLVQRNRIDILMCSLDAYAEVGYCLPDVKFPDVKKA